MILNRIISVELLHHELEFSTSRSSGPGGQNVNKVNTKVTLRWNLKESKVLTSEEKEFLLQKLGTQLTTEGTILITAQDKRSQLQNKEEVLRKLEVILVKAFTRKKKRKPTKPSKSAGLNRLEKKRKQSDKKKWRQTPL